MNGLNNMFRIIVFLLLSFFTFSCSKQEKNYDYTTLLKNNPIIHLYYFYSPGCADCEYVKKVIFPKIEDENKIILQVDYFNIDESENLEKVLSLEKKLKQTVPEFPVVFWGKSFLAGDEAIENNLSKSIGEFKKRKLRQDTIKIYLSQYHKNKENTSVVLDNIKVLAIIVSGLLDGINPCAFSTIIFLISFLAFMKFKKKEILLIGVFYTIGVFIFYFLAGFGFFTLLKSLLFVKILAYMIKYISIALVGILLAFSIFDIIKSIKNKSFDFLLSLPLNIKQKIHSHIRSKLNDKFLFLSAFLLGCFISFLELACTGQIYLPTILYMLQNSSLQMQGIGLLLLYNLFFIIPLILVFVLAYVGLTAKSVESIFKKYLLQIKIFTAVLFAFLLFYLIKF